MKILKMMVIFCVVLFSASSCYGTLVDMSEEEEGEASGSELDSGNYGTFFVLDEVVRISALTGINQPGGNTTGTIYFDENKGFGVQRLDGGGSKGISGKGADQDEALIFDFTVAQDSSIVIGLYGYEENRDDTIITLSLSDGSEQVFSKSHQNWDMATTSLGEKKVAVDVGLLVGQGFGGTITKLSVAETGDHIYVNSFAYGIKIPEPATIFTLGFAGVVLSRLKRK